MDDPDGLFHRKCMLILTGTGKNIAWNVRSVCFIKHTGNSENNERSGPGMVCTIRGLHPFNVAFVDRMRDGLHLVNSINFDGQKVDLRHERYNL